jgi:hypothetical protein
MSSWQYLAEAVDAAAELVTLGKSRWDAERPSAWQVRPWSGASLT